MKPREATLQERITFLQDLHRPLEEHWSHKFNFGLNPRTSDYMYKHHLSHLEDIYLNHRFAIPQDTHRVIESPVTQLYGINGLKSTLPKQKLREKAKETQWVSNFQKYQALEEPKRQRKPRIKPPVYTQERKSPSTPSDSQPPERDFNPLEISEEEYAEEQRMLARRRTRNNRLTSDELVLLGMYRFSPEQEEIYEKFVQMISDFNQFDMRSIVEDAFEDAQTDSMLADYGGTGFDDQPDGEKSLQRQRKHS